MVPMATRLLRLVLLTGGYFASSFVVHSAVELLRELVAVAK